MHVCEAGSQAEVSGEVRWSKTLAEEFQRKKKEKKMARKKRQQGR